MSLNSKGLTSGKLARAAGVNLETIRFYERRGLLPSPPRSAAGYRYFSAEAVQRVRFIRRAQTLGFSLQEIGELLALSGVRQGRCATVRARAQSKIVEIERKVEALNAMRKALQELVAACRSNVPIKHCPILQSLNSEDPPHAQD